MVVKIESGVLEAVATKLTAASAELPEMLAQARALDAGHAVARLDGAAAWGDDTVVDLRARLGILRSIDAQDVSLPAYGGFTWMEIAGAKSRVSESMGDINGLQYLQDHGTAASEWARKHDESLDDWKVRLEGQALDKLPFLDGKGQAIAEAYDWWTGYLGMLAAGGVSTVAATVVGKNELIRWATPRITEAAREGRLPQAVANYWLKNYKVIYRAPGTTIQGWIKGMIPFDKLSNVVPQKMAEWGAKRGLKHLVPAVEGMLPTSATAWSEGIFGRAWTNPVTGDIIDRGQSNLAKIAWTEEWGSKFGAVTKTAGVLRGAGVVGGVLSSGYDIANLATQGNPVDAFKRDKAGYVADVAKTGLDMSMTAALVAPSPVTWGAVAVTGTVYAGAELVDHWDDVTDAAGDAAGWVGDRADDVTDAVGDTVGGAVDAVKDSKVNPMNWF